MGLEENTEAPVKCLCLGQIKLYYKQNALPLLFYRRTLMEEVDINTSERLRVRKKTGNLLKIRSRFTKYGNPVKLSLFSIRRKSPCRDDEERTFW